MANSLTNPGQRVCLYNSDGTAGHGGIAGTAIRVKLYYVGAVPPSSAPNKNGPDPDYGIVEVGSIVSPGNGYSAGGHVISQGNWTLQLNGGNQEIVLAVNPAVCTWTCSGPGQIVGIAGAYITGQVFIGGLAERVLGWWERQGGAVTLSPGDSITLDQLTIRLV